MNQKCVWCVFIKEMLKDFFVWIRQIVPWVMMYIVGMVTLYLFSLLPEQVRNGIFIGVGAAIGLVILVGLIWELKEWAINNWQYAKHKCGRKDDR